MKCMQCVSEAKLAAQDNGDGGADLSACHDAVTLAPHVQLVTIPGAGTIAAAVAVPICLDHITTKRSSGLITG